MSQAFPLPAMALTVAPDVRCLFSAAETVVTASQGGDQVKPRVLSMAMLNKLLWHKGQQSFN